MWWGQFHKQPCPDSLAAGLLEGSRSEKGKVLTVSHQTSAGVLSGAAHIGPAREVIEIEPEAILWKAWY